MVNRSNGSKGGTISQHSFTEKKLNMHIMLFWWEVVKKLLLKAIFGPLNQVDVIIDILF